MATLDDFGLSEEQLLIRRNVAELLARVLPAEEIRRLDAASEFPHAAFDALAQAGYMALPYDPAYRGMGGSRKDLVILVDHYMNRKLNIDGLISRTYKLADINEGFKRMMGGEVARGVVVFD